MYGDPAAIRRLAQLLREQGDDIAAEADRLVALTETADWEGRAAEALRGRARERGAALRRTAVRHDDAARSLEAHAREVERRLEQVHAVERRVRDLLGDAAELAEAFRPPAPGHRDWLDVDVPGLLRSLGRVA